MEYSQDMQTRDAKIATVLYVIFLIPTALVGFAALGNIVMLVLMFTGVLTGSAAASGTWNLMAAIICTVLTIGLMSILKDFRRRMKSTVSVIPPSEAVREDSQEP